MCGRLHFVLYACSYNEIHLERGITCTPLQDSRNLTKTCAEFAQGDTCRGKRPPGTSPEDQGPFYEDLEAVCPLPCGLCQGLWKEELIKPVEWWIAEFQQRLTRYEAHSDAAHKYMTKFAAACKRFMEETYDPVFGRVEFDWNRKVEYWLASPQIHWRRELVIETPASISYEKLRQLRNDLVNTVSDIFISWSVVKAGPNQLVVLRGIVEPRLGTLETQRLRRELLKILGGNTELKDDTWGVAPMDAEPRDRPIDGPGMPLLFHHTRRGPGPAAAAPTPQPAQWTGVGSPPFQLPTAGGRGGEQLPPAQGRGGTSLLDIINANDQGWGGGRGGDGRV